MTIMDWPAAERPREKLLSHGCRALSDAELLAIFFRTGVKGKTAVDLARDVLSQFGDLRALLDISLTEFCHTAGLGTSKYVQLQAAIELGRRYCQTTLQDKDVLRCPDDTKQYLLRQLTGHTQEVFACLFLNSKQHLICFEELFKGTIDYAHIYPRIIVQRALKHNAAAVIVAHNHPSGDPEPSMADKKITQTLAAALDLVDVRLLDHIIIGHGVTVSLAELGLVK